MRRVCMLTVVVLAAALLSVPALAQNKWVRGPVKAMGHDTITVTVKGVESTFKIEPTTMVTAKGGSTAMKEAEKGKPAPKLGDFIKVGQHVEVHYKDVAGEKVATEVRPIVTATEAASEEPEPSATSGSSASGAVVSVAPESIVVKVDGKDMQFAVTPKTQVRGKGLSTKSTELKAEKKPSVITEFVKPNDWVTIYYTGDAVNATATGVRVIQTAMK